MNPTRERRHWRKEETGWIVQCDGAAGFIHGTNASTRHDAIEQFMRHIGSRATWEDCNKRGCYRVVKIKMQVIQ